MLKRKSMLRNLAHAIRANMLMGLFLTVPALTTVFILQLGLRIATDWLVARREIVARIGIESTLGVRLLAIVLMLAGFYVLGLLARNFVGRHLYNMGDRILARLPVFKGVYIAARKISESLFSQRKTFFKEVVFIEYPRRGIFSLAFVTASTDDSLAALLPGIPPGEPCVNLFVPTTPNPTSGVFIVAPRSELTPTLMTVAEALTFIMSAGAVKARAADGAEVTLLEKLESWVKDANRGEKEMRHAGERQGA